MKVTRSQLKQIIMEELNEALWKIEYNKKGEPRPATGKQEKGKHTKKIEADSAEEAQRKFTIDADHKGDHVVKVSEVEKEDKE